MSVDPREIRAKFGDDYVANDRTFTMGIDRRFTKHMAGRFSGRRVLETCTGAGFATIALAREAAHVVTIEIDPVHQAQARQNVERAGLLDLVTFMAGDVLDRRVLEGCPEFDSAFLDPDWAVSGPGHVYRFRQSNTQPPADALLERVFDLTPDVALVLSPLVDTREFDDLPAHERQGLFIGGSHEIFCLYFGSLVRSYGVTGLLC
ncbi:MAG: methyltransferase domain-containing protein [Vicinamibacteria bacterium]|nr:methyltransferase domain-containing protein [Vicinamibacteria bacterium]